MTSISVAAPTRSTNTLRDLMKFLISAVAPAAASEAFRIFLNCQRPRAKPAIANKTPAHFKSPSVNSSVAKNVIQVMTAMATMSPNDAVLESVADHLLRQFAADEDEAALAWLAV